MSASLHDQESLPAQLQATVGSEAGTAPSSGRSPRPCQPHRIDLCRGVITMGMFLMILGVIIGGIVWIWTTVVFFATGNTALALISLLIPPADIVLPFLISVPLGLVGIGAAALMFIGAAISRD